jgi:hypothetical protein
MTYFDKILKENGLVLLLDFELINKRFFCKQVCLLLDFVHKNSEEYFRTSDCEIVK